MGIHSKVIFDRKRQDPARKTLQGLLIGIAVLGMIEELILLLLCTNRMAVTLGLLLGLWVAMINSIYIYRSLDRALELDEENSIKAMRRPVLVRYCFMGFAILIALKYPQIFSPIGVIAGLFSLKISAYIQPFFMKKEVVSEEMQEQIGLLEEEEEEPSKWGFGIFHNQQ